MKTLLCTSIVFLTSFFAGDCSATPSYSTQEEMQILLTYPRSGTNLTLGMLQVLTRKPVESFHPDFVVNRLKMDLDPSKTPIWRTHSAHQIRHLNPDQSLLLMILRNYKECIVTHEKKMGNSQYAAEELRNNILNYRGGFRGYMENLAFFNQWGNEETKLLIYYEDLIKQPEIEFRKILLFLNEEIDSFDTVFEHYDYWKDQILGSYQEQHGAQHSSGGDKEIYHSKEFPISLLQEIDLHIKQTYPELWQKYLNRYETLQ